MNPSKLSIVIPVYNEIEGLRTFLDELLPFCENHNFCVIFVEDGSTDQSRKLLKPLESLENVQVLYHKLNRGYGGALKSGLRAVETTYALTMDSDGQHSTQDILPLLALAMEHNADLVVGNRNWGKQAITFRSLGKNIILSVARLLMSVNIHDLNSGFKLYRTETVQAYLPFCPNTMSFSDIMTLLFINQRQLVLESPITVHERSTGKSTINLNTALETLESVINISVLFNPSRIFLSLSLISIILGVIWGLPIILQGRGVSVGSLLLLIGGGLLFSIGLIAGQLSAIRMQLLEEFQYGNKPKTSAIKPEEKLQKSND